uniref:Uncharacterized protein n=1 Tax=Rhizophora mucronata TaxID=61149 RepID=A0A2P2QNM1_RHIMU
MTLYHKGNLTEGNYSQEESRVSLDKTITMGWVKQ